MFPSIRGGIFASQGWRSTMFLYSHTKKKYSRSSPLASKDEEAVVCMVINFLWMYLVIQILMERDFKVNYRPHSSGEKCSLTLIQGWICMQRKKPWFDLHQILFLIFNYSNNKIQSLGWFRKKTQKTLYEMRNYVLVVLKIKLFWLKIWKI